MTSTRVKAREAQAEHFKEHPDLATEEVQTVTAKVYDGIDALSGDGRDLLVKQCLEKLHMLSHMIEDPGQGQMVTTLCAIAGYSIQTNREDRGSTSTGDTAVDDVFADVKALITASMKSHLDPEVAAKMDEAAARVAERVAAGEEFEKVAMEEARAIGLNPGGPAPVEEDSPALGLYL